MFKTRKYLIAGAALTTALTLSACAGDDATEGSTGNGNGSGSSPSSETPSAAYNNADVTFAQMMLPHHEQAIEMSDIILAKEGVDARVLDLAAQIKAAQGPEIATLTGWLAAWGEPADSTSGAHHDMDGMLSPEDLDALAAADAGAASKLFLDQMIEHHEGAIDMAETEMDDGKNADAVAMATTIVEKQGDEIAQMKDLLAAL